jgi:predicted nuclease of restriction endonuclease-like (RecB) superfamily
MKRVTHKCTDIVGCTDSSAIVPEVLLGDLRQLIESARSRVIQTANSVLVTLYWNVGMRIKTEILGNKRADYGKEIVCALSRELTLEYGAGFSEKSLWHMCRAERWSTRTLRAKIQGMMYERTAISKKPDELVRQELTALRDEDRMTPDLTFRDPYLLDFLGLADTYSERDLEVAILRELERFLLELGTDFTFVARQKRITIDNEGYHLDLLIYHRGMHRLVAYHCR